MPRKERVVKSASHPVALSLVLVFMALLILALSSSSPNYRLTNISKNKSAEVRLEIADSGFSRMRGLMFRGRVVPILFIFDSPGIFPIHSHFCPGEFDAVYLSGEGNVVEIFRKIPPGKDRIMPARAASFLLELPPEITDPLEIREGDRISWSEIRR